MPSSPVSPIRRAWYRWKALRLPWRKRFLVGLDLHGTTFWEFRDLRGTGRWRRIAQYPTTVHHSDVRVSPQWHQWLRHMRAVPPTLQEQVVEETRQEAIKVLAAEADARWEAKERLVAEAPGRDRPGGLLGARKDEGHRLDAQQRSAEQELAAGGPDFKGGKGMPRASDTAQDQPGTRPPRLDEDPWKQMRRGPSEDWQPETWKANPKP